MFDRLKQSVLRSVRDELISLVEVVSPSVVTVRTADAGLSGGSGSGWCYAPGLFVTNNHVVEGRDPVFKLRLHGGALIPAELVGRDTATDLAVLRAEVDLAPLKLRTVEAKLGELCFAFGSPLGDFPETVTFGVVSGLGRRLPLDDGRSIEQVLQTDAEINPGNSGGPLVDLDGDVLGVNTAIRSDGRGVGFSVPSHMVASIVPELIEHGEIIRPKLGISIDVVEHHVDGIERERLRVSGVGPDTAFRQGDVLVSIASRPIENRGDLFAVLRRPLIGVVASAEVEREGQLCTIDLRLERTQ